MTFIMMIMYHWLNEDGHVHGASSGGGHVSTGGLTVATNGQIQIFTNVHLKGYLLPVSAFVNQKKIEISQDVPHAISLTLKNHSDRSVDVRISAKASPSQVKSYVDYSLLHGDMDLTLAPGESRNLVNEVKVSRDFPSNLEPFSMDHFVFGRDDVSAWRKMQGPVKLISTN